MLETLIYVAAAAGWLSIAVLSADIYNGLTRQAIKRQAVAANYSWVTHEGSMAMYEYEATKHLHARHYWH